MSNDIAVPEASLRPQKEIVLINGKEVAFPGQGTGARYVWDLCVHAVENGESSTYVVETAAANTTMSKPSINSQITYFRKATGLELSRRVNTEKAEEKARKEAEREAKKAEKAGEVLKRKQEQVVKLRERIARDTAKLAELEAELAAPTEEPADEAGYDDAAE